MMTYDNTPRSWAGRDEMVHEHIARIETAATWFDYYRAQANVLSLAAIAVDAGRTETAARWIAEANAAAEAADCAKLVAR